jgi:hypothetical protein
MGYKQTNNPLSRKTSPLNSNNPFKRISPLNIVNEDLPAENQAEPLTSEDSNETAGNITQDDTNDIPLTDEQKLALDEVDAMPEEEATVVSTDDPENEANIRRKEREKEDEVDPDDIKTPALTGDVQVDVANAAATIAAKNRAAGKSKSDNRTKAEEILSKYEGDKGGKVSEEDQKKLKALRDRENRIQAKRNRKEIRETGRAERKASRQAQRQKIKDSKK